MCWKGIGTSRRFSLQGANELPVWALTKLMLTEDGEPRVRVH
jgi:phage terminase large subunit-like protein